MKNMTRRQLLQRIAVAGMFAQLPTVAMANARQPLRIPPLIDVGRGRPVVLSFRPAQTQFNQAKLVEVWGANGAYLGPTVRMRSKHFVKLNFTNNLPQAVAVNIQGLQTPTEMFGSAHRKLDKAVSWSPIITTNQPAATCWYHADTMLNAAFQLYRGLAGLWIIEDEQSVKTTLPQKYGVNDIPLILQDQLINGEGVQLLDMQQPQFWGKRLFVNGQESAYLDVPRGWVRLRIVNASLSRDYTLQLDNGDPLYVIATGLGMFKEPLEVQHLHLAPSERAEVLVNLNESGVVSLISGEKRGIFYKIEQLFAENNDVVDNVVLELRPQGDLAVLNTMPTLPPFDPESFKLTISQERRFVVRPLDRLINQKRFDPKRIDVEAKKGTVERWYVSSNAAIGFILQGAKFIVETRNRQPEPYKQLAWRDTVWLNPNEEVTLLVAFDNLASAALPFSFGVSDFMLRDKGCMGQFTVSE